MITVPACEPCNRSYALDDEYFRVVVGALAASNDDVKLGPLWRRKVIGSTFRRSPKLRETILRATEEVRAEVEAEPALRGKHYIAMDTARINRVVVRTVRGLLWHHYAVIPRSDIHFNVAADPDLEAISDILSPLAIGRVGRGLFEYRHAVASEDTSQSLWVLKFGEATAFLVHLKVADSRGTVSEC